MKIHRDVPIKYFKEFKRVEPQEVDSSRLMDYKFCPQYYFLTHVLGYKPLEDPVYFSWGRSVHRFYHVCETEFKKSSSLDLCVGLGIQGALECWGKQKDGAPGSRFAHMTKARLSDLLMFLTPAWKLEKQKGEIVVVMSEEPVIMELYDGYFISGRPDQLILWRGRYWGRDFKTTSIDLSYYKRQLYPNDQFARYTYMETQLVSGKLQPQRSVAGQVIDITFLTKDKGPKADREIVTYTPYAIEKWKEEQKYWKEAMDIARRDDNYAMNERNCKYCVMHQVCREASQGAKEFTLRQKYKFEVWDNAKEEIAS